MSAIAQKTPALVTADEFLASTKRLGPGKHQLIDGVIVAMAPASPTHGVIQANLAYLVGNHLRVQKLNCRVMTEAGVKPRVRARTNVRIPDLLVSCGEVPVLGDQLVHEPTIIIEVLSPSNDDETESGIKSCASIPFVKEMLIVDSSRRFAEIWWRGVDGAWPADPEPVFGAGTVLLDSIGLDLSLDDIYAGTPLAAF